MRGWPSGKEGRVSSERSTWEVEDFKGITVPSECKVQGVVPREKEGSEGR